MQRRWLAGILAPCLLLAACNGPLFGVPSPPHAPSLQLVADVVSDTERQWKGRDSKTYVAAGYAIVEEKCGEFFDQLTLYKSNSNFLSAQVATAGAAAAGILTLAAASTPAIGIVAIGAGVVSSSISNFQNFATVTPYPIETRQLVFAALGTAKAAKPPNRVEDIYDARSTVAAYASYCTYAGIASLSQQALQNGANNTVNASPGTIPDALRLEVSVLASGPLTDTQLALIVVLKSLLWTDEQREKAVAAAGLPEQQKRLLFRPETYIYLSDRGDQVAAMGERFSAAYPKFGVLVQEQMATLNQTGKSRADIIKELSRPAASIFSPLPNPRVIVGR